jgi:hypothetical protein
VTAAARFLTLGMLLIPGLALAAPKKLTVLFTGDNGGEIGPCG